MSVDIVQEKAKEWAYQKRKIEGFDQLWLFAEQIRREELLLRNGVDVVVTDSPMRLGICYGRKYGFTACRELLGIVDKFDEVYPPLNIFLRRTHAIPYKHEGRYESFIEALAMDAVIQASLVGVPGGYEQVDAEDVDELLDLVRKRLNDTSTTAEKLPVQNQV